MELYYSATTGGFYDSAIHAAAQIPGDAVAITQDEHAALMAAQAEGKVIQAGADGRPEAVTRTVTAEETAVALRASAQAALDRSDVTVIRCIEHAASVPAAWLTYRAALREIVAGTSAATELPARPEYPEGT
jgi:hypothetical protein